MFCKSKVKNKLNNVVIICNGFDDSSYKYLGYDFPLQTGGSEKNVVNNIFSLSEMYKIYLVALGLTKSIKNDNSNITIIPMPSPYENGMFIFSLIQGIFKKNIFDILALRADETVILIHNKLFVALLIKLLKPRYKLVLILEGTFFALAWTPYAKNILTKIIYFLSSFIAIFLADRIITDKKDIWVYKWITKNKTFHIPNSIETSKFSPNCLQSGRKSKLLSDLKDEDLLLLYVGRLNFIHDKNPQLLLKSFELVLKKNRNINLLVIGISETDFNQLIKKYNCINLSNVYIIKSLPHEEVVPYYQAADLTLLTSRFEGTPYALLESLACGTPCVSTDVIDKSIIINGLNGFIAKKSSPEEFSELVFKGLKLSKEIKSLNKSLLDPIYDLKYRKENLLRAINSF